jgi:hypothetical protein
MPSALLCGRHFFEKNQNFSNKCNIFKILPSLWTEGDEPKKIMEDTQMFSWGLGLASSILNICHESKAEAIVDVVNEFLPF